MEEFAEILRDLIDDTGLTFKALAKNFGISGTQLSNYLKGSMPTITVIIKMSRYFNCSVDYLFGLEDRMGNCLKDDFDLNSFVTKYENMLKKMNMTQFRFAQTYDLSESSLSQWKSGNTPSLQMIYLIAIKSGLSMNYLLSK